MEKLDIIKNTLLLLHIRLDLHDVDLIHLSHRTPCSEPIPKIVERMTERNKTIESMCSEIINILSDYIISLEKSCDNHKKRKDDQPEIIENCKVIQFQKKKHKSLNVKG